MIKKIRISSKFMTSQPRKQTIAIHILSNISRSKCNQLMKFGQLMEYNMRNNFVKKSYTKCGGETVPRPFPKSLKLSDLQKFYSLKLYTVSCYCMLISELSKYRETKLWATCFYLN